MISSRTLYTGFADRLRAGFVILAAGFLAAEVVVGDVGAGELELSGAVGLEVRGFLDDPAFPGQFEGAQPSLILSPEIDWETNEGKHQFSLFPYLRLDGRDDERTHFDLREAYWRYVASDWELLLGANKVFWGVVESRHLVDIINQDDAVEDIDGEDKLGQPMVEWKLLRDWGSFSLYLLPYFRERTFPGVEGRLRPPVAVDTDRPVFESSAENGHVDAALRYSNFFGSWDLGVSYFDGTSREPRLLLAATKDRLVPFYDQIRQLGLDVQYTGGPWLWKFEGIAREGHGPRFGALVGGVEYTLYQVGSSALDIGLLAEVLYDGRDPDPRLAPTTIFDDDIFLGSRIALNDFQDTSVLAGVVLDREDGSAAILVESERRLGSRWKIELESRLFFDVSAKNPLASFEADDFVTLRLSRFF